MDLQKALSNLHLTFPERDVLVISRSISRDLHSDLSSALEERKKHDKCLVILTTLGGASGCWVSDSKVPQALLQACKTDDPQLL